MDLTYEQKYFRSQSHRAKWIFGIALGVLVLALAAFFACHLWLFGGGSKGFLLIWHQVLATSPMYQRSIDWVLWSIFGTTIFILTEITKYYPEIAANGKKSALTAQDVSSFVQFTPWYIMTFFRGPFLSLVILLFFNVANFNLTGTGSTNAISFNFSQLDHRATLLLAFVLGYYHRVARQVLDDIVAGIFSGAWGKVFGIKIEPDTATLVLGESIVFKTNPLMDVTWTASLGVIDVNGKYTAPIGPENLGATVTISALPKGKNWTVKPASVILVPFVIQGPTKIELNETPSQITYSVRPAQKEVTWKISPETGSGSIDAQSGVYTAPAKTDPTTDRVTITASAKINDLPCSAHIGVTLVK